MHITRVVTDLSTGPETIYFLNGRRVWINGKQSCMHVGTSISNRRNYMWDCRDRDLCALAYVIGTEPNGQHKIDPDSENIKTFLKTTKCLP